MIRRGISTNIEQFEMVFDKMRRRQDDEETRWEGDWSKNACSRKDKLHVDPWIVKVCSVERKIKIQGNGLEGVTDLLLVEYDVTMRRRRTGLAK